MAIIKCKECGKEISDQAECCIHCGYVNKPEPKVKEKEEKPNKKKSDNKKVIFICVGVLVLIAIIGIILTVSPSSSTSTTKGNSKKDNRTICNNLTDKLQVYVDNKDTESFDNIFSNRESFDTTDLSCDDLACLCPKAYELFIQNKLNKADVFLEKGLITSAYNEISSYIDKETKVKEYHDKHNIFKIISTKQKEQITGIYSSFGQWQWEYKVGGSFKFNKRYVRYGSSSMNLQFDNYSDKVLISGHLKPNKHKNWNAENNIAVEWYNYKIINNKIYIKLENEDDSKYDSIFEIKKLTDTSLSLKLLLDLEDVKKGQVYNYKYVRS